MSHATAPPDMVITPTSLAWSDPGRQRCLNKNLTAEKFQELQDHVRRQGVTWPPEQTIYVPLVVHVVFGAAQRPAETVVRVVQEILDTLNRDYGSTPSACQDENLWIHLPLFRDLNNRALFRAHLATAGVPNVQFILAHPVVWGRLAACDRKNNDLTYWDRIIKLQSSPAVLPATRTNLWVVIDGQLPFLGYAQFPEVEYTPEKLAVDGVVYNLSPPPYNLHKTPVHEMGHYLGLNHTFHQQGNGVYDDLIADTPYQTSATSGDPAESGTWPSSVKVDGASRLPTESKHMFCNLMDYTDDKRMVCFTRNQAQAIRRNLETLRQAWALTAEQARVVQVELDVKRQPQVPLWNNNNNNNNQNNNNNNNKPNQLAGRNNTRNPVTSVCPLFKSRRQTRLRRAQKDAEDEDDGTCCAAGFRSSQEALQSWLLPCLDTFTSLPFF